MPLEAAVDDLAHEQEKVEAQRAGVLVLVGGGAEMELRRDASRLADAKDPIARAAYSALAGYLVEGVAVSSTFWIRRRSSFPEDLSMGNPGSLQRLSSGWRSCCTLERFRRDARTASCVHGTPCKTF